MLDGIIDWVQIIRVPSLCERVARRSTDDCHSQQRGWRAFSGNDRQEDKAGASRVSHTNAHVCCAKPRPVHSKHGLKPVRHLTAEAGNVLERRWCASFQRAVQAPRRCAAIHPRCRSWAVAAWPFPYCHAARARRRWRACRGACNRLGGGESGSGWSGEHRRGLPSTDAGSGSTSSGIAFNTRAAIGISREKPIGMGERCCEDQ